MRGTQKTNLGPVGANLLRQISKKQPQQRGPFLTRFYARVAV